MFVLQNYTPHYFSSKTGNSDLLMICKMDKITDVTVGPCDHSKYIQPKRIYYKQVIFLKLYMTFSDQKL